MSFPSRKPAMCLVFECFVVATTMRLEASVSLRAAEPPRGVNGNSEVRQFPHGSYIYHVAFSPDGRLIATDDQVWDVATGKVIRKLPLPIVDRRAYVPFNIGFSPDSRLVAVNRFDDLVLVELATGKELWTFKLPPKHPSHYTDEPGLAFTPDCKHVVSARPDQGLIQVVEVATGKEVRQFPYDSVGGGLRGATLTGILGISADGKQIQVQSHETIYKDRGGLLLFELTTGKELARHLVSSEKEWVDSTAPSPDGRHAFYAQKNELHIFDLKTANKVRRYEGAGDYLYSVACSPDGKFVAACVLPTKDDKFHWIQIWDVSTGKTLRVIKEPKVALGRLVFSPDGKSLLTTVNDKTARLWPVEE